MSEFRGNARFILETLGELIGEIVTFSIKVIFATFIATVTVVVLLVDYGVIDHPEGRLNVREDTRQQGAAAPDSLELEEAPTLDGQGVEAPEPGPTGQAAPPVRHS